MDIDKALLLMVAFSSLVVNIISVVIAIIALTKK